MTKAEASPMLLCVVRRGQPRWEEAPGRSSGALGSGVRHTAYGFHGELAER